MKHAETILERPKKPNTWSPTLRNAGLLYRYWRLRLREKTPLGKLLQYFPTTRTTNTTT
jgi:hypothetical protein